MQQAESTHRKTTHSSICLAQTKLDKQRRAVLLLWTAAGFKVAWAKGTRSKVAKWIGLEFAPDFQSHTVIVRIPAKTAISFKQDVQELLVAPMFLLKKLRRFAGTGGWIMNLLPKARWTIQRCWRAIADEERRLSSSEAGGGGGGGGGQSTQTHSRWNTQSLGSAASGGGFFALDCCFLVRPRT